jgi:hypothetical protein
MLTIKSAREKSLQAKSFLSIWSRAFHFNFERSIKKIIIERAREASHMGQAEQISTWR